MYHVLETTGDDNNDYEELDKYDKKRPEHWEENVYYTLEGPTVEDEGPEGMATMEGEGMEGVAIMEGEGPEGVVTMEGEGPEGGASVEGKGPEGGATISDIIPGV